MDLVLGSAQFGMSYGISNSHGILSNKEIENILSLAQRANIHYIDTAISYGSAEDRLGQFDLSKFNVITKIPKITNTRLNVKKWSQIEVLSSLRRMSIDCAYSVLFHHAPDLFTDEGLKVLETLQEFKDQKVISKIGISIYSFDILDEIFNIFSPDLVQAPVNIIDRRLIETGWLEYFHKNNVEVHARSVFLQGLLLIPYLDIPYKFKEWDHIWIKWKEWLIQNNNIKPLQAAIGYLKSIKKIDKLIVGVTSVNELSEVVQAFESDIDFEWPDFGSNDLRLIDPSNWDML